jgi:hypothetical protein
MDKRRGSFHILRLAVVTDSVWLIATERVGVA